MDSELDLESKGCEFESALSRLLYCAVGQGTLLLCSSPPSCNGNLVRAEFGYVSGAWRNMSAAMKGLVTPNGSETDFLSVKA